MKKLLILLVIGMASCREHVVPPKEQDVLVGTKWERFALKSPVDNNNLYYYLEFYSGGKAESYGMWDLDSEPVNHTKGSYTIAGSDVVFNFGGIVSTGVLDGRKITTKNNIGVVGIYEKVL